MQKKSILLGLALLLSSFAHASANPIDPVALVDPMIGTGQDSAVTPGAAAPFGMVQWRPASTQREPQRPARGGKNFLRAKLVVPPQIGGAASAVTKLNYFFTQLNAGANLPYSNPGNARGTWGSGTTDMPVSS